MKLSIFAVALVASSLEGASGLLLGDQNPPLRHKPTRSQHPGRRKYTFQERRSTVKEEDELHIPRRIFLQSLLVAGSAFGIPREASAVDFQVPDITKIASGPIKQRVGGLANKIRNSCSIMDELQRDLMQENWDRVEAYPAQLRSYVPVFTAYTDSAFPSDAPTDKGLRVALRYEVGRFFGSVERFRQAVSRRALDEAYVAYSDMSLHLDRYLRVGGLYTYYDDTISLEPYYKGISESSLVYSDPKKDPPEVRDLVIMANGPDKGKTGIVIGIYRDGSSRVAVKLDRFKGMREIRVVPATWVAKRLGEQDPDDVFLIK